ncbi:MAG: helix-turn-helix transcriptional regulator, partial [Oscillospiraceae bacterium]|nr:helix-turn-helix transcriptional regulator [Oscillospiraceae bacterium]
VRSVRSYTLRHISRRVTAEELSRELGMSRSHFCRRFKEETGVAVTDFITELRIDEAKRLLTVSRKSLGEISDCLGFSSQSHFQNVFKAHTGETPTEYRKANIK